MTMTWMQALRKHNHGKGQWCMPRRGSAEHAHVRAMMRGSAFAAPGPRTAPGSRARAIKLTRGEETFDKSIARIEKSDFVKRSALKVRPLSRRGI